MEVRKMDEQIKFFEVDNEKYTIKGSYIFLPFWAEYIYLVTDLVNFKDIEDIFYPNTT